MSQHSTEKKYKLKPLAIIMIIIVCCLLVGAIATVFIIDNKAKEKEQRIAFETQALAKAKEERLERERIFEEKRKVVEAAAKVEQAKQKEIYEQNIKKEKERIEREKKAEEERIAKEKKAAEERRRAEEAKAAAAKKEKQRAAAEKARLADEKKKRSSLSYIIKAQEANLAKEQQEYNTFLPAATVELPVQNILQKPELPNGCEITAATIVINYLGHPFDKCTLADVYLPQVEFIDVNGKRVGGDPDQVYCGNPRYRSGGYYCFAQPIVNACNAILDEVDSPMTAKDITGASEQDLLSQLDAGRPVIAFATLSMGDAVKYEPSKWQMMGSDQTHVPFLNLHCVVLYGYDDNFIYIADPLKGKIQCKRSSFMKAYQSIGSRAVVITE